MLTSDLLEKHWQKTFLDFENLIDVEMRPIIKALNEAKYYTFFCCQGRRNVREFDMPLQFGHNATAYISFANPIPMFSVNYLRQHDFHVEDDRYGAIENTVIRSTSLPANNDDLVIKTIIDANKRFVPAIYKAFKLC